MADMAYVTRSSKCMADTVDAVQAAATDAGWMVLVVHDLKQRFVSKGFDWEGGLTIIEICNSKFATQMVSANPRLALHLPCPIVVREDEDGVEVSTLHTTFVAGLFPETDLGTAAVDVESIVTGIIDAAVA
jgi:uncharacterized protein (DUF302 family)